MSAQRICELDPEQVCPDCDGEPLTCLVRVSEDAGVYEIRPPMTNLGTIVKVLRHLASGWVESRSDQAWLREVADEIEDRAPGEMTTCPLCQEVACDSGCPMEPHRWDHYTH